MGVLNPPHRGPALGSPTFLGEPGIFKFLTRASTIQKNSINCDKFAQEFDFIILEKREETHFREQELGEAPFTLIPVFSYTRKYLQICLLWRHPEVDSGGESALP